MKTMAATSPINWHQLPAGEVARVLEVELPSGLSAVEVQRRREKYGPNRLTPRRRRSELLRFILQFHQPLIYLQADIGVAMGIAGTDVAKGAADMLLTDDNFATIEAAVEEGRNVFDNLTKFILWTLPTNFGQGLLILAGVFAGVALPILPVQLLWVNMTTVLLLGLMLVFEPRELDLMQRPPRGPKTPIMTFPMIMRIGLVSAMMLAGAFGLFVWEQAAHSASVVEARTIAVNVIVMVLVFYLLNCRSLTRSMFAVGVFSNWWIIAGIAAMIAAQLLFTYAPVMNRLFQTAPISGEAWLHILAVALVAYAVVGVEKWIHSRWATARDGMELSQNLNTSNTLRGA